MGTAKVALELVGAYLGEQLGLKPRFIAIALNSGSIEQSDLLHQSRILSTTTLQRHGVLRPEVIERAGGIDAYLAAEPQHADSQYFCVVDRKKHGSERLVAATRLLIGNDNLSNLRLPIDDFASLLMREVLHDLPLGAVAELGGASKVSGVSPLAVISMMREVLGWSSANGKVILVSGIEENIWEKAYSKFYGGAMTRMTTEKLPSRTTDLKRVPIWLHLPTALTNRAADLRDRTMPLQERVFGTLIFLYYSLDTRMIPSRLTWRGKQKNKTLQYRLQQKLAK